MPENDFTRSLEPQFRQSALHALLLDCLKGAAREAQDDRSGVLLVGLGHADEAVASYQAALTILQELGYRHAAGEPQAGLARVALAAGDRTGALAAIAPTLAYLAEGGTFDGTDEALRIELTCYRVLDATDDPRAAAVLSAAYTRLQSRAAAIADEQLRRMFLEQVPWHRELVAAWAATQAAP